MDFDTWDQWSFLRSLLVVAMATALLAFAWLTFFYKGWRDTGRNKEAYSGNAANSEQSARTDE
jgi:hypothetical protein